DTMSLARCSNAPDSLERGTDSGDRRHDKSGKRFPAYSAMNLFVVAEEVVSASIRSALQRLDALLERRVAGEQGLHLAAVDAEGLHLIGHFAGVRGLQAAQGGDHLAAAGELGAAGVGAELAPAREPHDDHR